MNAKWIAAIAAIMTVVACVAVIVSADDADAKNNDTIVVEPVNFTGGVGTLELIINENEYGGYVKDVKWSVRVGDVEPTTTFTPISSTGVTLADVTVKVDEGNDGKYVFSFTDCITDIADFHLKCEVKVTVNNQFRLLTLNYDVPLNGDSSNNGGNDTSSIQFDPMTADYGMPFSKAVKPTLAENVVGPIGSVSAYYWYAIGLPDGLSMTVDGTVTGIPIKVVDQKEVKLTLVNKATGEEMFGTMEVTVKNSGITDPGQPDNPNDDKKYDYKVTVNETTTINPAAVLAVQGEKVTMEFVNAGTETHADNSTFTVKVIDENGKRFNVTAAADKTYTIPTDGTGLYKVLMTVGTGSNTGTASYDLIVISDIENIDAGIIVQGA